MKKLMTTMLAVAVGVGLHAIGNADTGTSFEGLTGDAPYDIYASTGELSAQAANETYWVTNGTETLTVVAGVSDADNRPAPYEDATQFNYLNIKTTLGNPVTRNVSVGGAGTSIGSGFYFDSLVKFTAFDDDPAVGANGEKLAIWLKENLDANDEPISTNLVITAGFLDGQGGAIVTNYTCAVSGVNLNDGGWHRVTVKAIADITSNGSQVPGFVVYVDQVRATSGAEKGIDASALTTYAYLLNSEGSLFPSAVQSGLDKDKIAAVSFDGQGDVDDLLFTATAPDFAKDAEFFSIYLGEHVTSVQGYDPDGNVFTIAGPTNFVYGENKTVQILDWACENGWMKGTVTNEAGTEVTAAYTITAGGSLTANAKLAGAAINGTPYESAAAAFAAISGGTAGAGPFTVTLNTAATSGVELNSASASVVLDLAGNNITAGELDAAAITLTDGTLLVTNSTVTVGEVNGYNGGSALVTAGGALTIAGGIYNGAVDVSAATAQITGGSFSVNDNKDPDSETVPPAPNADLKAAAAAAGNELVVGSGSASYYTVVEKVAAMVNVTVTGGANATAAWTVDGVAAAEAPTTLTEGQTYSVTYTANAGYFFPQGATTSASGTAGTTDISITISDAVLAVAQIEGGAQYATLKEAVDAAAAGDTVTVLANCTVAEPIVFSAGITVSNDYEVAVTAAYALRIFNGTASPVTFCGTGTYLCTGTGSPFLVGNNEESAKSSYGITGTYAGSMVLEGGTLKIPSASNNMVKVENGTFVMNGGEILGGSRGIKADADAGSFTSAVTINGGVITNGATAAVAASRGSATGTATVTISGGDITGKLVKGANTTLTIPGNSAARFDRDQDAYCAPGYCTTLNDGWYTVGLATYTITYKDNEGNAFTAEDWADGYTAPTTFTVTAPATLPVAANIARDGVTFNGWTNSVGTTIAATTAGIYENLEVFADFTVLGPTYPSYINTSDATIKGQYDTWAGKYNVSDGTGLEAAFLLNVDPDMVGVSLRATAVSVSSGTVTIDVNHGNLNGYPYVKKAATVAGLGEATPTAAPVVPADGNNATTGIDNGGRITLTGESGATQFYQIGVQSAPVAVPNAD